MQYFYLVTLCESLKLPRVQSFHQLLYPPHGSLSNCDHGLQSDGARHHAYHGLQGDLHHCDHGLHGDQHHNDMVINITMIKVSMVIMVILFVITMSEWGVWSYSQSLLQPVCFTKEFYSVFLCLNMIYTNLNQIVFIRRSPSSPISLGRRSICWHYLASKLVSYLSVYMFKILHDDFSMQQTVYTGGHMIGAFLNTGAGVLPLKSFWLTLRFFGGF